jgi:hypothetical protein
VKVHVICPGFVKSRITDVNEFPMPFLMEADKRRNYYRKWNRKRAGADRFSLAGLFCGTVPVGHPRFAGQPPSARFTREKRNEPIPVIYFTRILLPPLLFPA